MNNRFSPQLLVRSTQHHLISLWKDFDNRDFLFKIENIDGYLQISCTLINALNHPQIYLSEKDRSYEISTDLFNQQIRIFSIDGAAMGQSGCENLREILAYQFALAIIQHFD
jgi:hypothetical protein